ncbi:T9SS type A sorting domain-containing protein [Chryseobacterium sp.]|uniref:T9SS type A sorting domain-containing protein n=1 Tax=Chryseobacterium sp. TaxID=1871047 RepID=UPI0012A9A2C5|nr:T9SS type A sorting domain-containing protein [Chryseobacterium sp.]QFG53331.1 T9SS type A sorting domain-containing protein [Chryseobacterium sp.]
MNKILFFGIIAIPFLGFSQVTLNQKDDFESYTTANWTKVAGSTLSNQNVTTGGPLGIDDNFLRVQANGGTGADSQLLTFNNAQWMGDYITAGITYISMDVRNSGSNIITLRLSFRTDWTDNAQYSSTTPIAVVPGQGWKTIIFPIDQNSLTRIGNFSGPPYYNQVLGDASEVRILHNDAPSWTGDPIVGVLDIDNIQARNTNLDVVDLEKLKNDILLHPNPSSDFLMIQGISKEEDYKIVDLTGKIVKKGIIKSSEKIDIKDLGEGVYFLSLNSGRNIKFIKKL